MRRMIQEFSAAAAVLLAAAFLAPGAGAQVTSPVASQVEFTSADWVAVAGALVQSSARAPGSESSYAALIAAANAYRLAGRPTLARHVALDAAKGALQAGFAVTAARAYLAAATLSGDLHEPDSALDYYARCRQLADLAPTVHRQ